MAPEFKLPSKKAVIYWPVGTGDSTTLVLKPGELVVQIDLHHMAKAETPDVPEWEVIDHLIPLLPKGSNGRPYLAAFILTHPDQDHVKGFAELLRRVDIGELWHTPKIFRDRKKGSGETYCEDAKAFRNEAHRRRKAMCDHPQTVRSGDRLRVIGHDDVLNEEQYKGLPDSCKSRPGDKVAYVDGLDRSQDFHAFIHAPFVDDQAKDKNNTSLALNVVINEGEKYGQFFFFGDREYPTIKRIFEQTEKTKAAGRGDNTAYLMWDVMLCAHHCSKAVMYWQEEGEAVKSFKPDIMAYLEKYNRDKKGYIVSSSVADFKDEEGANPPHKKAREKYQGVVKPGRFICTHEYPTKADPRPLVFTVDESGCSLADIRPKDAGLASMAAAVSSANPSGKSVPPSQTSFGEGE